MKNGQLKPAYNIQFGVDAQYVVWVTEGSQPNDTTTRYACADFKGCSLKEKCIHKGGSQKPLEERFKQFEVAKKFQEQRELSRQRLTSPDGIELRVNRSIQAEGAFAQTKGNLSFRRFLSRGRQNILVEAMLLAMAHNMTCLHNKIQNKRENLFLFPVSIAA